MKRLVVVPLSVFCVIVLSFLLVALIPQSTALTIAGDGATAERVAQIEQALGLDKPLWAQFADYLTRLAHLDLGSSFYSQQPVFDEITSRLTASLELATLAFVISVVLGVTTGALAAFLPGKLPDYWERATSTILHAVPEFLLGIVGIYVIFFVLGWVPAPTGRVAIGDPLPEEVTGFLTIDTLLAGDTQTFGHVVERLVLPTVVLGASGSVIFARMTRAGLSEAIHSQALEYARAIGLPRHQIVRYALLDIRTTLMTYIAIGVTGLVSGAAIIETLFSWPGIGQWGVAAMNNLDPPAIQGFVLVTGLFTLLTFLALDVLTVLLDPRVRLDDGH